MRNYDREIFDLIIQVINNIPVALVIDNKVLVMHAGINSANLKISDLKAIPKDVDVDDNELLDAILWTEPQDEIGLSKDHQGRGGFGPDISRAFLEQNSLLRIIRGHTNVEDGFDEQHDGKIVTVWSAPARGEKGSFVNMNSKLDLHVEHFDAFPVLTTVKDWGSL